jgi:hypothetical protein
MGGMFRAPKPVAIEAPHAAAQATTVAQAAAESSAAAEDAAREARIRAVERARRGLPGTIGTSDRGVLAPMPAFAARKTLLGE